MYRHLLLLLLGLCAVTLAAPASLSQPGSAPTTAPAPARAWRGKWIWTDGDPAPRNSYTYFRNTFEVARPQREAQVHLTADSRYLLYVNGAFIGRGPVRSDRRYLYYDSWNVQPHLKMGKNVIAVLVHHYGEYTFQYQQGRGGLLLDAVGFGGLPLTDTGPGWKALRSEAWAAGQPRMSIQLGFNEMYDANKESLGWKNAAFDDSKWPTAKVIGPAGMEPWPHLTPRDIPPMLEKPILAARVLEAVEVEDGADSQHVDLLPLMEPKTYGAAYLATTLISPDRREVELKFGSDDALKVWLNGQQIVSALASRAAAPDQETARVTLEPGENRLLAKVVQGHSKWEFYFRMAGETQGVRQQGLPGMEAGVLWSAAGPFTFPKDDTLKTGFDQVFAPEPVDGKYPELDAALRNSEGAPVGWRRVRHVRATLEHVSQQMAAGQRRAPRRVQIDFPNRVIEDGKAGAVVKTADGLRASFLIDFGKEVTGFPHFRVRGARGGEIVDMGYGEVLHDAAGGFLPQSSDQIGRLNPDRDGVHYADRYVCRPGDQEFQTFDKRAGRYLQIDVRNAPAGLELDHVGMIFSTYPVEYNGSFACSDERLNKIWEIGRWTNQLNMEDGYTDCPWRERGQWWGDARVEALINYYTFGDTKLIRKALRQKGQSLNDEGITWGVYPTDWDGGRLPSFTLIWVSTLWETYQYTGDREIVAELYPKIRKTLDTFFAPKVSERGLLKDVPYWVFIDWAPVDDKGEAGALNAYYYDALRAAAEMGKLLGDASASEYERRAAAVKAAMNRHLWDAEAHAYRDSILPNGQVTTKISQQTNSLCVYFDIAPREEHGRILDFIYAPANKPRVVEAGSPYFSYYQLAALYHAGRHEQALAYIRERWGRMLDWGATTWWEMWSPGASFCHAWSGGPTYNLSAEVLGVKPLKPGFSEVSVTPQWVGLTYASGIVPTVKGDVRVAWQRDPAGKHTAVRVETVAGIPAEITLPVQGEVTVNKKAKLPLGVLRLPDEGGAMRFRMEKGGVALFDISGK